MGGRGIKRTNQPGRRTWVNFTPENLLKIEQMLAVEKHISARFVSRSELINKIVGEYFDSTDFKAEKKKDEYSL